MKKKIIKLRTSRLWDATVVYNYDWVDGDTCLAKEGRPIKGRQMNRLLSGGGGAQSTVFLATDGFSVTGQRGLTPIGSIACRW